MRAFAARDVTVKILTARTRQLATLGFAVICSCAISAQTAGPSSSTPVVSFPKGSSMTKRASGAFDVKVTPQKPDNPPAESANLGRMSLDKQFRGPLEAVSTGEMLSVLTEVQGSAGYVAMERVRGKLDGRKGTFVLQHSATMTRSLPQMSITVVPDSGTGELVGISGSMTIRIEAGGKHFYEFDYALSDGP